MYDRARDRLPELLLAGGILASAVLLLVLQSRLTFLLDVSEPFLRPFRAILPTFGGFDFSPIIAFFVLRIVSAIVVNLIRG